jgi:hypothetical protein
MDTSAVTIAGKQFSLRNPYVAGHSLTEGEASALNQLRHENVRNNSAKLVKEWTGDPTELELKVDEYDAEYIFKIREAGEPREASDPITTEAKALARLAIKGALEKAGQKADAKQIAAAVATLLADPIKGAQFRQVAEQRVNERKALAEQAMGSIDLSSIGAPATAGDANVEGVS